MKKLVSLLAVVFLLGVCYFSAPPAFAAEDPALTLSDRTMPLPVDNTRSHWITMSYLTKTADGYMKVASDAAVSDEPQIFVEYYDDQMNYISGGTLQMELPIWGGFYAGEDAYYIVEGQNNEDEDSSAEVIRVIKYSFDWKRLGAASITSNTNRFGGEVRYPFDTGTVSMAQVDGTLFIATGHEGYVDANIGKGHQGLLVIKVDTGSMTGDIVLSDLYHSFAQYLAREGSDLYLLEQSEGNRRTQIKEYDTQTLKRTGGCSTFDYGGERTDSWAVACYASVDGLAVAANNVLGVGTSIDQSGYDNVSKETAHNIYLTVTPRDDMTKSATR